MELSQKKQNEMTRLIAIQAYTGRQSDELKGLTSGGVLQFFWRKCEHQFRDAADAVVDGTQEDSKPQQLCPKGNKCPFAHTSYELEQGQRVEKMSMCLLCPSTEESVRAQTKPVVKKQNKKRKKLKSTYKFCLAACANVYNKRTQTWNEAGHDACPYGETCKFAHNQFEVRFGTALEARMNPKKQEVTQEAVLPASDFAFDPEDAEDESGDSSEGELEALLPLPQLPLTIIRTDSSGSFTTLNGGTVDFMCLEHKDGTVSYLPQSPIRKVPLCSSLTSLESLPTTLRSATPTLSESSFSAAESESGLSIAPISREPSMTPPEIVTNSLPLLSPPAHGSYGYAGYYLPVPGSPGPTPSPTLQAAIPAVHPSELPVVLVQAPPSQMAVPMVQQGGVAAAGLCPVPPQQQFWQSTVQYVQQGLCMSGQFQEQMYATHVY